MKAPTVPTLAMMVAMLFAFGMPVSAQASDWKEYEVVCIERSSAKLVEYVNKWMKDGWQPLGGAFGFSSYMCQAMVKE